MGLVEILLLVLTCVVMFWLCFPLLILLFSLRGQERRPLITSEEYDFACIITVYKNLNISLPLVNSILNQTHQKYHIYLVADQVEEGDYYLQNDRLSFIKPQLALNSKVLSIDTAMRASVRHHDYVLILDPDNLIHPAFLSELNDLHQQGYMSVQGKRTAKNLETNYAALDAMGEYYYDYLVRNAPFEAGSSSTIAGSGMSIERKFYHEVIQLGLQELKEKGVVISEDKTLQLEIVSRGERIAYAEKAIVFDEKVSSSGQIERQRTRWLNSYFRHLRESLELLIRGISGLNFNQMFFGLVVIMPPLFILVVSTIVLFVINLFVNPWLSLTIFFASCIFLLSFLFSLKLNRAPREIWKALVKIPYFMWSQCSSMLNIRAANRDFMATSHQYNMGFEEVWEKRKKDFE